MLSDLLNRNLLRRCALAGTSLFFCMMFVAAASAHGKNMTIPILYYHFVENVRDHSDSLRIKMDIRPDVFDAQLKDLMSSRYETIFVRDIPALANADAFPEKKRIALTFDDGYEDFYTDALPILKKYHAKATLFLVNNFLDRPGYLTKAQVTEIMASGLVEIGAHTLNHFNLPTLPLDQARKEIFDSKQELNELFGINITSFAYPYGKYSRNTALLVKEAGFSAAVTTDRGFRQYPPYFFVLNRIPAAAFLGQKKWLAIGDAK